jgi:hypothetical protein
MPTMAPTERPVDLPGIDDDIITFICVMLLAAVVVVVVLALLNNVVVDDIDGPRDVVCVSLATVVVEAGSICDGASAVDDSAASVLVAYVVE